MTASKLASRHARACPSIAASFTGNPAALRFALSSIGKEMSVPTTSPDGPMSAAASVADGPAPAATSSTR
jgi:hypothetical protein